ncbi:acyl CoA:acetate/3-ketoacid CoA transferase, alpha subunit [Caldisphaera lagunensis DSM 15908]|uniref:Acyl CoA:acetate/3-ketoacid CoA transferase, alpha subunit n=1 Tax=Caldisphaera lagunensis (strain DSM 15908 / JCM 11604 / ANMR 0165 / IC-154) TaxID=1056495 RepID=L0A8V6_CALLD|nr:CoA-transferase [Caldisphaera lagunensis]AFZ69854.1 acyl CoA:acetate/3-ketoacid CoA transferase, alpha subunit [Caldisphaera lagunensis DSM 15908]
MPTSKIMNLNEAVDLINNGDLITISGITFFRNPMSFISALIKSDKKDLSFVDREPGFGLDVLTASNKLKMIRAAMATFEHFGLSPNVRKAAERKQVDYLEDTCGAIIAGFRAGAQGVPFMPVRGIIGSDLVNIHEKRGTWKIIKDPFTNEDIAIIKAIEPDVAIIHVHMSDEYGNSVILGPRYEDELKIRAAKKVIITAERIVDKEELKKRNTEQLSSTSIHVDAVIHSKNGAWPTGMYTMYEADYKAINEYYNYAKDGKAIEWINNNLLKRWY